MLRVRDGHAGSARHQRDDDEALRDVAARASAAERAAAAAAGAPGDHPGLPAPAPARRARRLRRGHRGLDPGARRRARCAPPSSAARRAGLQAFGVWTAGAVETAIASSTGVRATDR